MISIGIDIAKEKITVCALEQGSKIVWKPFDVHLSKTKVEEFLKKINKIYIFYIDNSKLFKYNTKK